MADIRSTAWQQLRGRILANAAEADQPCWICRRPIDYQLTGTHPQAPSVDHLVPRFLGGDLLDPYNLAVCHFGCNSRRGAKQSGAARRAPSRRW